MEFGIRLSHLPSHPFNLFFPPYSFNPRSKKAKTQPEQITRSPMRISRPPVTGLGGAAAAAGRIPSRPARPGGRSPAPAAAPPQPGGALTNHLRGCLTAAVPGAGAGLRGG